MKKTSLLFAAFSLFAFASNAQTPAVLAGTSYTQNFNTLNSGLPTGWYVDTAATATSIGMVSAVATAAPYYLPYSAGGDTTCNHEVSTRGFKNYPSANAIGTQPTLDACPNAAGITDRALGVRQIGTAGFDPGAAFSFFVSNTPGLTNLAVSFKLQSLDTTSSRETTWMVDYGIGANPTTFTEATLGSGTWTTGNHTFSNNTVTATFGSALDNKTTPIWIRIRPSAASTGSGNRASTAIDDFTLTWTGTPNRTGVSNVSAQPELSLTVLGDATSSQVSFAYYAEQAGNYNFAIYDLSGRMIHTETVSGNGGQQKLNVTGLNLASGMYIAKMFNGNSSSTTKVMVH